MKGIDKQGKFGYKQQLDLDTHIVADIPTDTSVRHLVQDTAANRHTQSRCGDKQQSFDIGSNQDMSGDDSLARPGVWGSRGRSYSAGRQESSTGLLLQGRRSESQDKKKIQGGEN